MKQMIWILREKGVTLLVAFFTNLLLLIAGAFLIEAGMVQIVSGNILVLISVIVSVTIGTFLSSKTTGVFFDGILFSLIYAGILLCFCFLKNGAGCLNAMLVKLIVSVTVGMIVGNFFGCKRYYKTRTMRRKRFFATRSSH